MRSTRMTSGIESPLKDPGVRQAWLQLGRFSVRALLWTSGPPRKRLDDRFHETCVVVRLNWWNGWVVGGFLVCGLRNEELYHGRMAASGRIGNE
jgi:hypothetical protein